MVDYNKRDARIQISTNSKLKEEATEILQDMQLDMSTIFNVLLAQIVKKKEIPFKIELQRHKSVVYDDFIESLIQSEKDIKNQNTFSVSEAFDELRREFYLDD
ncbi:MAG: type II toxin-antitoxin system RelB/DinJ family antitoxin [Lactobacillales bacterium]|jgi:addiction module RelB/DinJ family antitoxin|nr:type II toxin-antitoxin system RelB/DinJ family antitoxin [Lactobacillales bacterium]